MKKLKKPVRIKYSQPRETKLALHAAAKKAWQRSRSEMLDAYTATSPSIDAAPLELWYKWVNSAVDSALKDHSELRDAHAKDASSRRVHRATLVLGSATSAIIVAAPCMAHLLVSIAEPLVLASMPLAVGMGLGVLQVVDNWYQKRYLLNTLFDSDDERSWSPLEQLALLDGSTAFVSQLLYAKNIPSQTSTLVEELLGSRTRGYFKDSPAWHKGLARFILCEPYLDQLVADDDERQERGAAKCASQFYRYLTQQAHRYQGQVEAKMLQLFKQRHPDRFALYACSSITEVSDEDYGLAVEAFETFATKALTLPYDTPNWTTQLHRMTSRDARVLLPRQLALQVLNDAEDKEETDPSWMLKWMMLT